VLEAVELVERALTLETDPNSLAADPNPKIDLNSLVKADNPLANNPPALALVEVGLVALALALEVVFVASVVAFVVMA
jgi:hypothetical protein